MIENINPKLLSIVMPAYLQERTIGADIENVKAALETLNFEFEIIVVADGDSDATYTKAQGVNDPRVKVFGYKGRNRGKGYALRYGAVRAQGNLVVFLDSGMEINPQGISMLWEHMKWYGADAVIGSKRHPASKVDYPPIRKLTSFIYQLLTFLLFGLKVRDTQTGIKIFKREVLEKVLPRLLVKTYAIDIEILAVAHHLGFTRIYEAPVDVNYRFDDLTHSATIISIWRMIKDTLAVFYRLRIRHYYDDGNERKWVYDPDLQMKINIG